MGHAPCSSTCEWGCGAAVRSAVALAIELTRARAAVAGNSGPPVAAAAAQWSLRRAAECGAVRTEPGRLAARLAGRRRPLPWRAVLPRAGRGAHLLRVGADLLRGGACLSAGPPRRAGASHSASHGAWYTRHMVHGTRGTWCIAHGTWRGALSPTSPCTLLCTRCNAGQAAAGHVLHRDGARDGAAAARRGVLRAHRRPVPDDPLPRRGRAAWAAHGPPRA